MLNGFNDIRGVTVYGVFYLCCMFSIQLDMGRNLTSAERRTWTKLLNKEIANRNRAIYKWAKRHRPDLAEDMEDMDVIKKEKITKECMDSDMIVFYNRGNAAIYRKDIAPVIMYTNVEVAIVSHFYAARMKNERKFTINEIFDFSRSIVGKIKDMPILDIPNVNFNDMLVIADMAYRKMRVKGTS